MDNIFIMVNFSCLRTGLVTQTSKLKKNNSTVTGNHSAVLAIGCIIIHRSSYLSSEIMLVEIAGT